MYVCVCKAVTENDIKKAVAEGARTVLDLKKRLHVAENCGCCLEAVKDCLREATTSEAA